MFTLRDKLNGSTIIEVIMAMIIILTCLGIAMAVFNNMSRDVNDELLILAEIRVNTLAAETKQKKQYSDIDLDYNDMIIKRTIQPHPYKGRLKIMLIEAVTPFQKKITTYREIISVDDKK
jgi:hypothetical protein